MGVAPLLINGMRTGATVGFVCSFTAVYRAQAASQSARREAADFRCSFLPYCIRGNPATRLPDDAAANPSASMWICRRGSLPAGTRVER